MQKTRGLDNEGAKMQEKMIRSQKRTIALVTWPTRNKSVRLLYISSI